MVSASGFRGSKPKLIRVATAEQDFFSGRCRDPHLNEGLIGIDGKALALLETTRDSNRGMGQQVRFIAVVFEAGRDHYVVGLIHSVNRLVCREREHQRGVRSILRRLSKG